MKYFNVEVDKDGLFYRQKRELQLKSKVTNTTKGVYYFSRGKIQIHVIKSNQISKN